MPQKNGRSLRPHLFGRALLVRCAACLRSPLNAHTWHLLSHRDHTCHACHTPHQHTTHQRKKITNPQDKVCLENHAEFEEKREIRIDEAQCLENHAEFKEKKKNKKKGQRKTKDWQGSHCLKMYLLQTRSVRRGAASTAARSTGRTRLPRLSSWFAPAHKAQETQRRRQCWQRQIRIQVQ